MVQPTPRGIKPRPTLEEFHVLAIGISLPLSVMVKRVKVCLFVCLVVYCGSCGFYSEILGLLKGIAFQAHTYISLIHEEETMVFSTS